MVDRVKAAADARTDRDFFLIARTDAIAVDGVDAAIERAQRCVEAGADGIFAEAEIPAGWGLLVRSGDAGRLARTPVPLDAAAAQRVALLEMIAVAGTRAVNRAAGIVWPPGPEAASGEEDA